MSDHFKKADDAFVNAITDYEGTDVGEMNFQERIAAYNLFMSIIGLASEIVTPAALAVNTPELRKQLSEYFALDQIH